MSDLNYIGKNIRARRKELGLTSTQIRDKVGISTGNLSDIENGKRTPSCQNLILLSEVLECSVDWLLKSGSPIYNYDNDIQVTTADKDETYLITLYRSAKTDKRKEFLQYMKYLKHAADEDEKS